MALKTKFWAKPIPTDRYDWECYDDDVCGCHECHAIVGRGSTEAAAIADYEEQLAEEEENDGTDYRTEDNREFERNVRGDRRW